MYKLLIITLWTLSFFSLILGALFLFSFTQTGNTVLKPYVKEALEGEIGLPVDVKSFKLEYGTVRLTFLVNKQVRVKAASHYDIWNLSFKGIYHLYAKSLSYEDVTLDAVDLKGDFKGGRKEIDVKGKGTALGAKMHYSFKIMNKVAHKIIFQMKDAELSQMLKLLSKPALVEGKIDVEVNMPHIREEKAEGYGKLLLHSASFDPALVKQLYGVTLPEESGISAKAEVKLRGDLVTVTGEIHSDLFTLLIKDTALNLATKQLNGVYNLDVKEMRILTKNKLLGGFKATGNIKVDNTQLTVTGKSTSLDGELLFTVGKSARLTLKNISLEKMLILLKQTVYAEGKVSGTLVLEDVSTLLGEYDLRIDKGRLLPKAFAKQRDYKIPAKNQFSLTSKGNISKDNLTANVAFHSSLATLTLSSLTYDLKDKILMSDYDVVFHDIGKVLPKAQVKKGTVVSANGIMNFNEKLMLSGELKGLGKKVAFQYDSKQVQIDASQLLLEKVLALMGVTVYVNGTVDAKVTFANLKRKEGTFSLKSTNLVTQPSLMKKWIGKALKTKVKLESFGTFKKEKIIMTSKLKTTFGNISLKNMVYDKKRKILKSDYVIDVVELKKLQPYIDKKVYGPMVLKGVFSKEKILNLTGETTSLGGKIAYRLHGKELRSTITAVPLQNILGLLGHKKIFLGQAFGKGSYHLKQKTGVVDLDIRSFQIKPSTLTQTLKIFLGKDPARIIFSSTKFHADIKKKSTSYSLVATGSRSSITIRNGIINKVTNTHRANFTLKYEKYTVHGKIKGSADNPKITVDTHSILQEQLSNGKLKEKLEKALDGKAGKFLRGLSF